MDQCSRWAYKEIVESGVVDGLRAEVLAVICSSKRGMEANEIWEAVKRDFRPDVMQHSVLPRMAELEKMGLIYKNDIVESRYTGMRVNTWDWTGRKMLPANIIIEECCPRCKGLGRIKVRKYNT
jgi:hypothetical protein